MLIILLFLIFLLLFLCNNENFTNTNEWIILLTMCVEPNQQDRNINEDIKDVIAYRKKLYTDVINRWLDNTKYLIYVVESSGYKFDDIKNNRLTVFSFKGDSERNSSIAEAKSILYALEQLKKYSNNYTHILKVTGKYYLYGIENILYFLPDDYDIYIQQHNNIRHQNTEYYGIKKELFFEFANTCTTTMEHHLYNFMQNKKIMQIPATFSNNVKRACGDIITNL